MKLEDHIRTIPDHPKPGIMFRDVTTLMAAPEAFAETIRRLAEPYSGKVDAVAGIEARGFIFGAPVAVALGVGFIPLRKPGKLPYATSSVEYELEYGTDALHMHTDACGHPDRVLVIDDLIATGGTALAAIKLLRDAGAVVEHAAFVVDLPDLPGAGRLREAGVEVRALCAFGGH
ncbi:adenine phosphoribosyltransferase [Brevundimonas sp. 2R-24]|uniref:Adenine phosphoribosyltransferase n=1 Tax=Peiella sedimenti TaxID=3061083 RepID=A0ABT8SLI7_9CAUL|nr:adenine phosphoribosyltransferase [Caulobacteraceae bacterium XZ-24]